MMNNKSDKPIFCLSYFTANPGCINNLTIALNELIHSSRAEKGCLLYELAINKANPNFLIMVEKFINEKVLALHEKQPYIENFLLTILWMNCAQKLLGMKPMLLLNFIILENKEYA